MNLNVLSEHDHTTLYRLADPVAELRRDGYEVINIYTDGVVLMAQGPGDHDLRRFIGKDGTIRRPHTARSMTICAMVHFAQRVEAEILECRIAKVIA